jgi:UDP-N-acetylmuramate--L-alanine ligase/UDP-N-acetylenolpyruvoylglucosamine reductase
MNKELEYEQVCALLSRPGRPRAHAMGVCGVGLSGVARLLAGRGWRVSGCDADAAGPAAARLVRDGVAVRQGHDPAHLDDPCDLLIRSTAVADQHPEVVRARSLGIPVVRRGVVLAALLNTRRGIAICGTHGKTTTACMTLRLLQVLGLDPDWCIGGATRSMGEVARQGGAGPLVVEGDESDGTLACYAPSVLVVTNVDADHLEHFGSLAALHACFAAALDGAREGVVYCADDEGAARLCAPRAHTLSYGFAPAARLRIAQADLQAAHMALAMTLDGRPLGTVTLPLTGRHNALNAAAALGAALALGCDPARAFQALAALDELPGRRFERLYQQEGITVVSDYSHHPAEIAALVSLARLQQARRTLAVFQPHRYTRTLALGAAFPPAFAGIDDLLLLPVYAASEAPLPGGDARDLYGRFREFQAPDIPVPRLAGTQEAAVAWLLETLREGDQLLVIGAGDVVKLGEAVAAALRQSARSGTDAAAARLARVAGLALSRRVPLAPLTTLGVGGRADLLAEVATEAALADALRIAKEAGLPVRVLGGGSNLLVSDLGVRGLVVRLAGGDFGAITCGSDGIVRVGAGVPGARLLKGLTEAGFDGLSFMEGIPGTVGGWLATNAGAHGACIGNRVRAIRGLKKDGTPFIVKGDEAGFSYRACRSLETRVATAVELELCPATPAAVAQARRHFRGQRLDFGGHRSAGSVFRNPAGVPAGRLLDAAACKGLSIGGAQVYARHANVIVTQAGATASDVLVLMQRMQQRVQAQQGVDLVAEVRIWQDFTTWPF